MFHYFTQLPKDKDLDFEVNERVSRAIMKTAKDAFTPFYQYLDTTIKALDKKEDIKAKWEKVKQDNLVELKIIGRLYEIPKTTTIELLNVEKGIYTIEGIKDKDFDEPLIYWVNKEKNKIKIYEENFIKTNKIRLPIEVNAFDKVSWAGEPVKLEPAWIIPNKKDIIYQDNKPFKIKSVASNKIEVVGLLEKQKEILINNRNIDFEIVEISKKTTNCQIIKEDNDRYIVYDENNNRQETNFKLFNLVDKDSITFEDGSKFRGELQENLVFKLKDKSEIGKTVICNHIKFKVSELYKKDKNQFWIQLLEIDENQEDIPGFTPLKYFFDDDISIKDNKGNEYNVAHGIESEYKLILRKKTGKRTDYIFPQGDELTVRVNTYQLRKQLEAVLTLQNMPVREHSNLIKLFEDRDKVKWKNSYNEYINDWIVLTDENRSGSQEQREFVEKALSTPDFAILEGPPGSGKTTVILELICQLAKQGKRILLCGSTHVAIDNVLERLHEKRNNGQTLIQEFNILPVRIGDENRINEDVKEFQIDNLKEGHNISEALLLDAADLVCGTTIGILQHPKFKNRKSYNRKYPTFDEPIVPEFDYLIIDESSKTTFQEFLVPALYAKKWILAGDVMQLSPFTNREQIVTNLETLQLKNNETLPSEYQQATFYLHKILEVTKYAKNKFVLPLEKELIEAFRQEVYERMIQSLFNKDVLIRIFDKETYNRLELTACDIIIIDKNILNDNLHHLPETHAVLRLEIWQNTEHAFIHNNWQEKGNVFKLKNRGQEYENSFEIVEETNNYFKEKSWAEEIAWRIDREHQLRLLGESKTKNYRKVIEEFMPLSLDKEDILNRIDNLASIAFPSILESLIKGIKSRHKARNTTISEGFTPEELQIRRTILKYQHRMHPEISAFPRERFYKENNTVNALLDLEKPTPISELREWNYPIYRKRSIWIDVKGKTNRNRNEDEAKILLKELKKFIEFAENNNQPEGKEWTVACLTFYKGQETIIREKLQKYTGRESAFSNFRITKNGKKINIKLHTVDKFQGHEADIVFLSMVQTERDGFMDNPNRLNVAITRAKFQLVIIGNYDYFSRNSRSEDLKQLALSTTKFKN